MTTYGTNYDLKESGNSKKFTFGHELYKVKYWDDSICKFHHFLVAAENFDIAIEIAREFIGKNSVIDSVKCIETTIVVQEGEE